MGAVVEQPAAEVAPVVTIERALLTEMQRALASIGRVLTECHTTLTVGESEAGAGKGLAFEAYGLAAHADDLGNRIRGRVVMGREPRSQRAAVHSV